MAYCVNPQCAKPQTSSEGRNCHSCGHSLLLNGKYVAVKEIGRGGFGRTFLAVDYSHPNKRRCVIKQLFPDSQNAQSYEKTLELFHQEAQQLRRLSEHPQIPDCFESFEENNQQFIIQEFVDGHNLNQRLMLNGFFTEAQLLKLLKDILPVLDFIHQKGVIHRDIKPANIIYSQDNTLWLVDLGAAKQLTGTALAKTGTVIGSAEYTAPEQVRGKATFASDIYSLGVTCIYLLTGVSPFNLYDTGDSRWVWRDFLPNAISPVLGELLDKMIQMSTNKRYQTVQDIQTDLIKISLQKDFNTKADKDFSRIPVSKQQPLRFKERNSYKNQTLQPELQQEDTQPEPLKISAEKPGELATSLTDKLACFWQSLRLPNQQAKALLILLSSCFSLSIYASRYPQYRPSQELTNNKVLTLSSEDTSYDSYLETSADWEIKTDLYSIFVLPAIVYDNSKIGFMTASYDEEPAFAIWDLERPSSQEPFLTPLSSMDLNYIGLFKKYGGEPLVIDSENQLRTLDILTGETSLIPDQQEFSLDDIEFYDKNGFLVVNATKSTVYHAEHDKFLKAQSIKVWDVKTGKLLTSSNFDLLDNRAFPSISHENIFPFSLDGNWLISPNDSWFGFELRDLIIGEQFRIQGDAASFSPNKNFLIVEKQNHRNEFTQVKLFDLRTKNYVFQSSKIKQIAMHPHQEIAATFDENQLLISNISKSGLEQIQNLGNYPRLQNLKFSPDGKILAGRLSNHKQEDVGELIFWDAKTGKVLEGPQKIGGVNFISYPALQFSPNGRKLFIRTDMGQSQLNPEVFIQIWDVPQPLQE